MVCGSENYFSVILPLSESLNWKQPPTKSKFPEQTIKHIRCIIDCESFAGLNEIIGFWWQRCNRLSTQALILHANCNREIASVSSVYNMGCSNTLALWTEPQMRFWPRQAIIIIPTFRASEHLSISLLILQFERLPSNVASLSSIVCKWVWMESSIFQTENWLWHRSICASIERERERRRDKRRHRKELAQTADAR